MKFSILLPTRNRLAYLRQAVETVLRQDYGDWEIVVSDNDSEEDIAGFVRSLGDPRVKYYRTDRFLPVTDNWNNALKHSTGDYVLMLGDDDGLLRNYFVTVRELVERFEHPDLIYTGAFIFAYPGVLPRHPDGLLHSTAHVFAERGGEPFLLGRDEAEHLVRESLSFRAVFGFNSQFFVVSRRMVEELSSDGPFYRSPFPDYYSSNLLLLRSRRTLVLGHPLVVIGVSPKSYGFFHNNQRDAEGIAFLNSVPDPAVAERLKSLMLPWNNINNGWLLSMETLSGVIGRGRAFRPRYEHYRWAQVLSAFVATHIAQHAPAEDYLRARRLFRTREKAFFALGGLVDGFLNRFYHVPYPRFTGLMIRALEKRLRQFPTWDHPVVEERFENLLEVFERVDPRDPRYIPGGPARRGTQ